jgi:hypothetical protein
LIRSDRAAQCRLAILVIGSTSAAFGHGLEATMNGHWYGRYSGTNNGQIVIELDDRGEFFEGSAYAYDGNPSFPSTFAHIKTIDKSKQASVKVQLAPLDPRSGEITDWKSIVNLYPNNIIIPNEAQVDFDWNEKHLIVKWKTNISTSGAAELSKSEVENTSTCVPLAVTSWLEFKDYVTKLEHYRYIFRGQSTTKRLRTPFHRTGRGDMRRFFLEDVFTLHRHLSARTRHFFDLSNPMQNGAFLNLVQHHGYPTPLLDWTYSPFVAAFFAYQRIKRSEADGAPADRKVRIFVFDKFQWCSDVQQILSTNVRWPHFSILEPVAIGNERLIPQQALSSFTTVDDIETYIQSKENETKRYLQVIDLPVRERDQIMRELGLMGITAGSLFPGLDGACEELRERFFRL